MKLEIPENENYSAIIVAIEKINKLEGCDNVVGVPLLGFQAIVTKDTEVGQVGVVFTAETQLSEEYVKSNNLYRHSELNSDPEKTGYIEDNRRVKAMKFRGHRSDALFMPLESLEFTGVDVSELNVGDVFDKLNDKEVCKKYTVSRPTTSRIEKNKAVVFKRVDEKFLPMHYDTENYWRNKHVIKGNQRVVVTQKLHGTSIRIANTIVKRQLSLKERIAQKLGVEVAHTEFDHVYGSRRAIKDPNNPLQDHYYDVDIYTEEGKKLDASIPENFIVYGELIGYVPGGGAIQKNYTYRVPEGTCDLYIYRVAVVTNQGMVIDLAWEQVKEFCRDRGLKVVPELWVGQHKSFDVDKFMDKNYFKDGYKQAVPLDKESPCDEGVCIRVDGIAPYVLKAKSPKFFEHETKMLDEEVVDIEEVAKEET
jgi:hypothetical protein